MATTKFAPITVIVPIYGDLPSLLECVASLVEHVDQRVHNVLLMNDSGPLADEIEQALTPVVASQRSFRYSRNPSNLGFVGNCNRAVFEIDDTDNDVLFLNSDTIVTAGFLEELQEVLLSSDRNGTVCPRSNNATIASLPYALRNPSVGRTQERTQEVYSALAEVLPRFSISPVSMGFCILIRRSLINQFGLFDDAFAPGYGEENDFCLRIARHGYLSLIAHRALVMHVGALSFTGARRHRLRTEHEKLLMERYPNYAQDVRRYLFVGRDPVDVFADVLVPDEVKPRLYIDIDELPRGGKELARLKEILTVASARVTTESPMVVAAPAAAVRRLKFRYPRLMVIAHNNLDGIWDAGILIASRGRMQQLLRANRVVPRWVVVGLADATENEYALEVFPADMHALAIFERMDVVIECVVDPIQLRQRWQNLTAYPGYADSFALRAEPWPATLFRWAEGRAPMAVVIAQRFFQVVFRSLERIDPRVARAIRRRILSLFGRR